MHVKLLQITFGDTASYSDSYSYEYFIHGKHIELVTCGILTIGRSNYH